MRSTFWRPRWYMMGHAVQSVMAVRPYNAKRRKKCQASMSVLAPQLTQLCVAVQPLRMLSSQASQSGCPFLCQHRSWGAMRGRPALRKCLRS